MPPDHLSTEAIKEWRALAPAMFKIGILTELDRGVMAAFCQSAGEDGGRPKRC